jgi:hypothetical protein
MATLGSAAQTVTPAGIEHRDLGPLFIVGHARSGTSILTDLIRAHLRIAFGTESQFIVRIAQNVHAYGDLRDPHNRWHFVQTMAAERFFSRSQKYGFRLDVDAAVRDSGAGTYRSVLTAIFGQLAHQLNCARWGDKTPEYAYHLPLLFELFPDASFIHVIRDGRDVALSTYEMHFGAKNAHAAARDWVACIDAVEAFRRSFPQAPVLDVRYEDLLADPQAVFASLVHFLHIVGDETLAARIATVVGRDLRSGNSNKWRTRLSTAEQRRFEAVAGTALARYGYDRVAPDVKPPSAIARMYWFLDDRAKRAGTPGYFRDTLYRAGLRLGAAGRPLRALGKDKAPPSTSVETGRAGIR